MIRTVLFMNKNIETSAIVLRVLKKNDLSISSKRFVNQLKIHRIAGLTSFCSANKKSDRSDNYFSTFDQQKGSFSTD